MEETWWRRPEQLDGEQRKVIALPDSGSHLVLGPPGSGKTNLLLLRAAFLHKLNVRHIAVLTVGRVLREFLAAGVSNYPFSDSRIQTHTRWSRELLKDNGVTVEGKDFKTLRINILTELEKLAARDDPQNIYDCLLLDEAQDFSVREINVFRRLSRQVFAVGDRRQRILEDDGSLACLEAFCDTKTELTAHYRNGLKICRVADGVSNLVDLEEGLEASANYEEEKFPSSVQAFGGIDIANQVAKAVPEIEVQLRAYPTGYVGVLCPRHPDLVEVWKHLSASSIRDMCQLQRFDDGYEAFDPQKRVIVTTLHGAKGLEFRALHLLAMDMVKNFGLQRNMTYTAITRAKTSLAIYHNGALPSYLEKGMSTLEGSPTPPPLDDLFL
jgi:superfamily I DNA/RNA helicase